MEDYQKKVVDEFLARSTVYSPGEIVWCLSKFIDVDHVNKCAIQYNGLIGVFKAVVIASDQFVTRIGFKHLQDFGLPDPLNLFGIVTYKVYPLNEDRDKICGQNMGPLMTQEKFFKGTWFTQLLNIQQHTEERLTFMRVNNCWIWNAPHTPLAQSQVYGTKIIQLEDWSEHLDSSKLNKLIEGWS
jgi:hypothetical protein